MELRRAADALLRSRVSPLAFQKASVSQRQVGLRKFINGSRKPQLQRNLASSTSYSTPAETIEIKQSMSPLARRLLFSSPTPARKNNASSHFSDPDYQSKIFDEEGSSAGDMLAAFNNARRTRQHRGLDFSRMEQPPGVSPSNLMEGLGSQEFKIALTVKAPMRLKPQIGRTIHVGAGVDLVSGIRMLEQGCARNKIKSDSIRQRFHERPGLKRKRLKSLRWRKNFMVSFRAAVRRVNQLRKQGW